MKQKRNTVIENFDKQKILVIGDAILDIYHTGVAIKINHEAPVPVVRIEQ